MNCIRCSNCSADVNCANNLKTKIIKEYNNVNKADWLDIIYFCLSLTVLTSFFDANTTQPTTGYLILSSKIFWFLFFSSNIISNYVTGKALIRLTIGLVPMSLRTHVAESSNPVHVKRKNEKFFGTNRTISLAI